MSFLSHRNFAGGVGAVRVVRTARGPNPLIIKKYRRKRTSKRGRCGRCAQALDFTGAGGTGELPPYARGARARPGGRARARHTGRDAEAPPAPGYARPGNRPPPPRPGTVTLPPRPGTLTAARQRVTLTLNAAELNAGAPKHKPRIRLSDRTIAAEIATKSLRKAQKGIREGDADNLVLVLQGQAPRR